MPRSDRPTHQDLLRLRNHYTIAKRLNSQGIVKPIGLENYGNGYVLVMADEGYIALSDYVSDNPLNLTEVLAIASQLATILDDLYRQCVIHKDINPSNILIEPITKQIKLTDFGLCTGFHWTHNSKYYRTGWFFVFNLFLLNIFYNFIF